MMTLKKTYWLNLQIVKFIGKYSKNLQEPEALESCCRGFWLVIVVHEHDSWHYLLFLLLRLVLGLRNTIGLPLGGSIFLYRAWKYKSCLLSRPYMPLSYCWIAWFDCCQSIMLCILVSITCPMRACICQYIAMAQRYSLQWPLVLPGFGTHDSHLPTPNPQVLDRSALCFG